MVKQYYFCLESVFKGINLSALAFALLLFSCDSNKKTANFHKTAENNQIGKSTISYAVGFDLKEFQNYKILHLFRHYNESVDTLSYVLHEREAVVEEQFLQLTQIEVPIKNIALLHTSYLPFFQLCETTEYIKAISEAKYIYDENIYTAVIDGDIPEVNYGESLDKERLLELNISTVVTVGWPNTPNKSQQKLGELGIPVLIFSDWQESTLLGRAEWVKVIAALTGADDLAKVRFDEIVTEYNHLKSMASKVEHRPSIICNLPYKGSWYVPGGNSYMSNVLHDAGGDYLWTEDTGSGGIQIDFELVYAKGLMANYWINPGAANNINDIIGSDERLKDFLPIQDSKVFNYTNRIVRGSANDYWESAMTQPHFVLADFIKILHPELLPDHELFYYKQLK